MREELGGWYTPTADEFNALWGCESILVLDANALLYPYRVPPSQRARLFDLLRAFNGQLWCPYQAALEYQRHRLSVIQEQRDTYADLTKRLDTAESTLTQLRRDHPMINADQFKDMVKRSIAGLKRWIDEVERNHPQFLGEDRDDDVIRDDWDELLKGRIGEKLSIDDGWKREADKRYSARIPPGFEDAKRKDEGREYGDLIIWKETLAKMGARSGETNHGPRPIIFITDDMKADWWRIESNQRLGPRPELVDEMRAAGGSPFWIYSLPRFVSAGATRLRWPPEAVDNLVEGSNDFDQSVDDVDPRAGS